MIRDLERLTDRFASGEIDRRGFLAGVLALTVLPAAAPQLAAAPVSESGGRGGPPVGVSLNHVSLAVSDVAASQRFYERVLGLGEVSRQPNGVNLGLGDSFLGLYRIDPPGHAHHFCVGVDGFEIQDTAAELRQHGIEPFIRQDRPELYFSDPDGVRVQLSAPDYRG